MHAVQLCRSAFFGSQPRPSLLSQGLKRSASLASPQITPAPWPSQRLFHNKHIRSGSAVRVKQPRHASFGWGIAAITCAIGGAAAIQLFYTLSEKETSSQDGFDRQQRTQEYHHNFTGIIDTLKMSSYKIPSGHIGNLTQEQEVKLREMWAVLFKLFNIKLEGGRLEKAPTNPPESSDSKKKSRRSFFGFGGAKKEEPEATPDVAGLSLSDHDDKYGMNKDFKQAVADLTPEQLRDSLWAMLKADHPDSLILRFLRARKWDVDKAVVMLISTIRWRLLDMHVDDDVMGGEARALEQSESSDHDTKRVGDDFMDQTRMGKSFIHGVDKRGRPICMIRVKLHKVGVHCEKSTERYTVHMIETARLMLPRPVETAVVMFDMTGFTLSNMDYAPVKFIIKCFEANYPESLGVVLIHQAPWIFSGIWKIIKGWLDPVVAAKVHFTNTTEDLEVFIDRSRLLKEYGGEDNAEFEYIEPQPGENDAMKDTVKREEVLARHKAIAQELQDATKHWIEAAYKGDEAGVESWKAKREELATKYSQDYWVTDPYIRARSVYDRNGVILGGGKVKFYSEKGPEKVNGTTANGAAASESGEEKAETNGTTPDSAEKKTVTPEVNGVDAAAPAVAVSAN